MMALRRWSVRNARVLERAYRAFEPAVVALAPLWRRLGHDRLEAPAARIERGVKGLLFDCQMCGRCILSATGMSCAMNCPKGLRNGPCGGVRADGACEVKPAMPCV
ncbi:MAG: methylenetetrahydrofolate reductase C-terminal domain-containing protein, partial [Alphaproteobacteria bacterium]